MWFLGPLMTRKQWIVVTCPTILMLPWLWRFLGGLCYPDFSLSFQATHSDPNLRQEQWKSGCLEVVMLPTSRSPRQSNGKTQPTQLRRPPRKSLRALLKKKCNGIRPQTAEKISQVWKSWFINDAAKYRLCATCWPYWHTALPRPWHGMAECYPRVELPLMACPNIEIEWCWHSHFNSS